MQSIGKKLSTVEKALQINLDEQIYGTVAEIGAGQEVARYFFLAGGAAGTIAKTMSAYDMQVSDAIYGQEKNKRYVSLTRVKKMIHREYNLVVDRLHQVRSKSTKYFAFADTVVAKGYKSDRDCHGWLGIKFQPQPTENPCEIVLHVRMKDNSNIQQQNALGILGVNLIYSSFYHMNEPEIIIESLLENLTTDRIEIDMIKFDGDYFKGIDNRLMALHLVRSGLTRSVFFTRKGEPVQAYDLLYKKNILVLRGSFRPFTIVHSDIINCARTEWLKSNDNKDPDKELIVLTEISMSHLMAFGDLDKSDFLGRVDTLCAMGFDVQISDFTFYHNLKVYLEQFTKKKIAIIMGIKNIAALFKHETHKSLSGGLLEALSRLFSRETQVYVYPKLLKDSQIRQVDEMTFDKDVEFLFQHFLSNNYIIPLKKFNKEIIDTYTRDIRESMHEGKTEWISRVPGEVFRVIKEKGLFGYKN